MLDVNLVKIGSDGVNEDNIKKLVIQSEEHKEEHKEETIFISSGSVALGRTKIIDSTISRASLASVGQIMLMQQYQNFSSRPVGQGLLSDHSNKQYLQSCLSDINVSDRLKKIVYHYSEKVLDLAHKREDKQLLKVLQGNFQADILTVLNHNDTLSSAELSNVTDKTDNDKNAVYLAKIVDKYQDEVNFRIKRVIFLTNTNGLLDGNKTVEGSEVDITDLSKEIAKYMTYVIISTSKSGTGGMESKVLCALQCLLYGVQEAIIANADNGFECIHNKSNCTTFANNQHTGIKNELDNLVAS